MTTSIRVPDTISKLAPNDPYPVVQGVDVGGFAELAAKVDEHNDKIASTIDLISALERKGNTFKYAGITAPSYPAAQHGNYVLLFNDGFSTALTINPPTPIGGMMDGALFTIFNQDTNNRVTFSNGESSVNINNADSFNIPAENFASFIYDAANNNYLLLESGYIPASKVNIQSLISLAERDRLHTFQEIQDEGFLKGVRVGGDTLTNVNGATWIQFQGATVTNPKPGQALVAFKGTSGATSFLSLTDTPAAYAAPNYFVRVNAGNNALEFAQPNLSMLTGDVQLTNPQVGDSLFYNGSKWANRKPKVTFNGMAATAGGVVGQIVDFASNFLYVKLTDEYVFTVPDAEEGDILWVVNDGEANVKAQPRSGIEINGVSGEYTIVPSGEVKLIYDASASNWVITANRKEQYGITVQSGQVQASEITRVNFPNSRVESDGTNAVRVTPYTSITKGNNTEGDEGRIDTIRYLNPIKFTIPPITPYVGVMEIKEDSYKPMAGPSLMVGIDKEQKIVGESFEETPLINGAMLFNQVVFQDSNRLFFDKASRTFKINREADAPADNPDLYIFAAHITPMGRAPNDGFLRLSLTDTDGIPVVDSNGKMIAYQAHYKQGDTLKPLVFNTVLPVSDEENQYQVRINANFNQEILLSDRVEGPSVVVFQSINDKALTSEALSQYQIDTGLTLRVHKVSFETSAPDFEWLVSNNVPTTTLNSGVAKELPGLFGISTLSKINYQVSANSVEISDATVGGDSAFDFMFIKILTNEQTALLREGVDAHGIFASIFTANNFNVAVMSWTGNANAASVPLYETRNTDNTPVWKTGWSVVKSVEVANGFAGIKDIVFVVPEDANNIALVLYPKEPTTLEAAVANFYRFEIGTNTDTTRYLFSSPLPINEKLATWSEDMVILNEYSPYPSSISLNIDPLGPAYGHIMPVGVVTQGPSGLIKIVKETDPGLGFIEFEKAGTVSISTDINLYTNQPAGEVPKTTFWYSYVVKDGVTYEDLLKIPESETEFSLFGGIGDAYPQNHQMRSFTINVKSGDRISLRAFADRSGGAFLKADKNQNTMLHTVIKYKSFT